MVFIVKVEDEEFTEDEIIKALERGLKELKSYPGPDSTILRIS